MYFRLPKDLYAAECGSDIILLDVKGDKYFSITDRATPIFKEILSGEFVCKEGSYFPVDASQGDEHKEILQEMVMHFLEQGFIEPVDKQSSPPMKGPLKEGGLAHYVWDYKSSLAPFSHVSKKAIFHALMRLFRVHRLLKKRGIEGILRDMEQNVVPHKTYRIPEQDELKSLSDSIDVACALYPKKVFCLGWASTFVLLALDKGWKCNIAIGVQTLPFYAHAWAECDGQVINDERVVQEYLSVLLRKPFDA